MTTAELKIRIQKATEKIQKKAATIEKKENWIASGKKDDYEIRWLQDDIKRLKSEITETQNTIEKYEKQFSGEMERERIFMMDIPNSMKDLQTQLVDLWNTYDFEKKANLKSKYQELGYREFLKNYKHTNYEFIVFQMQISSSQMKGMLKL